ncbi:acetylornithine deacetylase/succinyl-diaminopimelate desuccinylase-like protein [Planomicrobium koreense]|uniref:Acetylornithine deacetylase/succinyl-diaminopimelate desuccinylase-like protein n=1 Tax=Planococcus koreensis TaxID=112331 RepID=A0A7W8CQE8_9BACL|nr:dipeptidase [Planococcus koreensis]MBB5179551.1 acetylornithine deacetylase/succinyl-diaminopimelate desuccinylase-like protein [Planococcus koreensis]
MNAKQIDQYFKDYREQHLEELKAFLRIPSVSSLSEHKDDVRKGAEWLKTSMQEAGLENAEIFETDGHPVVYADWLHAEGKPNVLVYGHYDVQPVDPLNLWETPPFDPHVRDNKLYARGASDDKGQTFMHVKAVEALLKLNGELPVNIKFIVEGEEEIGSPNLPKYVEQNLEQLKADLIVISDTGMQGPGRPAVCYGLRGLAGIQIDVKGPKGDLHSGLYGGAVQNPLHAIVEILQSFRDKEGVIQVEGFYDDVLEVSDKERAEFAALEFDLEQEKKDLGITEDFGEKGYSFIERTWIRPTLEINGITGGFSGEGIKTVLPAEASSKITCRLVPNQDPDDIVAKLRAHVEAHKPAGVTVNISEFDKGQPFLTPYDHPAIQAAGRSYERVYNVKTAFTRMGGSVPIVAVFDQVMGLPVVLMGFGLSSENFHAPNEHFHLENFDKGLRVISDYLFEAAKL